MPSAFQRRFALRPWLTRMLGALVVLASAGGAAWWWAGQWTPDRAAWPTQGVLMSADNGAVPWGRVKAAGANFVYLAATRGSRAADPRFARNYDDARAAGFEVGAVHHYDLCELATNQAENLILHVPRDAAALPAVIMLERPDGCRSPPTDALALSELTTFLNQVEAHLGKPALIGMDSGVVRQFPGLVGLGRHLWLRRPLRAPDFGGRPWTIWQANDLHRMTGVSGTAPWLVLAEVAPTAKEPS